MSKRQPAHHLRHDARSRCKPPSEWPREDQRTWASTTLKGGLFDDDGPLAHRRAAGVGMVAKAYGRWLTWLDSEAMVDPVATATVHATPESIKIYARHLLDRNAPRSVIQRLHGLRDALNALAPTKSWGFIRDMERSLSRIATPVRDKRAKLRTSDELQALGVRLCAQALDPSTAPPAPVARAALFRDGLAIALLAARPLRMRTFTALDLTHFDRQGDELWLRIQPELMKTNRAFECPIPNDIADVIATYIEEFRPVLIAENAGAGDPGAQLWVSVNGRAMTENALGRRILATTKRELSVAINPHMFRDALATTIAETDPVHVHMASSILGHTSITTTERFYNHGRAVEACRQLHRATERRRKSA